ncbi:MAG: hypothetical protein COU81_00740 [Candidatus Portnoybacteria bacterium CG10_big_fil_rev_8_21_14_0_10_36_7]|uniref:Type II secretion system protein GspG C-terminal domain-containing protein n=1 Tax=Candidatus Portnoybacteria bacterium CG10_big_fil_rev_8_21_14_0_10_36_7 TaxID=1974812 RepID=A0A2M8KET1_9BACT|nr:MAG: hypothetical protein COU81_00740 [Candidatus Portnoybacteria bacterium CG10_big_fil_rev_8_21_14_0_10_36_7]
MKKNKAFTLIELLVVIFIIALLASIVSVQVSKARSKARDTKRKADIKTLQTALELYYDATGSYPIANDTNDASISGSVLTSNDLARYVSAEIVDPSPHASVSYDDYQYYTGIATSPSDYAILACFENTSIVDNCCYVGTADASPYTDWYIAGYDTCPSGY